MLLFLACLSMSCAASKTMTVGATASLLEDVAKSAYRQSDLKLIREGMPAYLMLIGGMVEAVPDNEELPRPMLPLHRPLSRKRTRATAAYCMPKPKTMP